jgi:hypothetical protein
MQIKSKIIIILYLIIFTILMVALLYIAVQFIQCGGYPDCLNHLSKIFENDVWYKPMKTACSGEKPWWVH